MKKSTKWRELPSDPSWRACDMCKLNVINPEAIEIEQALGSKHDTKLEEQDATINGGRDTLTSLPDVDASDESGVESESDDDQPEEAAILCANCMNVKRRRRAVIIVEENGVQSVQDPPAMTSSEARKVCNNVGPCCPATLGHL